MIDPAVAAFAASAGVTAEAAADVAPQLAAAIAAGRAAWPGVSLAPAVFAAHLGRHVARTGNLTRALDTIRPADLWLACACANGDAQALAALEQRHLPIAARAVARFGDPRGFVADALQELRERLLVGAPPRIAAYAGTGSLEGWIKVAAVRVAINLRAKEKLREGDGSGEVDEPELAELRDPELDFIKAQYRGDFTAALRDAFGALDAEERAIMRFYLIDKLDIAEIGNLLKLSRATIGRRIVAIREKVLHGTQDRLKQRLAIATAELDSLIALVRTQVDVSLSQVLGKTAGA